jgi:hypothetical protein
MALLTKSLLIACLALPTTLALAQATYVVSIASPTDLKETTDRGRLLYQYDQAAWHATDAVEATNPKHEEMGRYIAVPTAKGWVVAFGRLNDTRDAFLPSYLAIQGKSIKEFTVEHYDSPKRETGYYLFAAKAIDLALKSFHGEKRPYNVAALPAQQGQLCVYIYPAQTENGIFPLGGDERYLISADGTTIIDDHRMHNDVLTFDLRNVDSTQYKGDYHTHVLSDLPEDTDVFFALAREGGGLEFIATRSGFYYEVKEDGSILPVPKEKLRERFPDAKILQDKPKP